MSEQILVIEDNAILDTLASCQRYCSGESHFVAINEEDPRDRHAALIERPGHFVYRINSAAGQTSAHDPPLRRVSKS